MKRNAFQTAIAPERGNDDGIACPSHVVINRRLSVKQKNGRRHARERRAVPLPACARPKNKIIDIKIFHQPAIPLSRRLFAMCKGYCFSEKSICPFYNQMVLKIHEKFF
ncbi:MAG: hypothetical protein MSH25_11465 [Desulfovibrio sp.]|uniref:hypothetical protein n=1 Tax=Desulfovibrio sp. TaxID=885 RepID=UPI0025C62342|nr:hypothetical protein [Desulfovibrio sp.]MCI7569954.1 hypothetical protein [Desulfovibrio sp.]